MDHRDIWGYTPLSVAGKYLSTYLHLPTTKSNETIFTAISFLRNQIFLFEKVTMTKYQHFISFLLWFFQLFFTSKMLFSFSLTKEQTPNWGLTVNHTLEKEKLPAIGMQELTTSYLDVVVAVILEIVIAVILVVVQD